MDPNLRDDAALLATMLAERDRSPAVYHAAPGWQAALDALATLLRERGLVTFRQWPESSGFNSDVHPFWRTMNALRAFSLDDSTIATLHHMQQLVLGNPDLAFLPYRISMNELRALALHLCDVVARETGARSVREIGFPGSAASPDAFVIDGKTYTVGALTYYRRYAYLTQFVDFDALESIVELGSGDGRQAEVIKQFHPHLTYYMVDIPPVLYVGSQCMEARFRAAFVPFAAGNAGEAMVLPDGAIAPFGNWQMERLRPQGRTLFLSCASLGEMHRNAVANYLKIAAGVADVVYLMQVMHGRRSAGASFVASDDVIGFDDYVAGLGPEFALIDRSPAIDVFGPERDDFTYENAVWQRLTPRAAGASRAPG